jgi:hypothetical protein
LLPKDLSDLDSWEGFEDSHTSEDLEDLGARVHEIDPSHIKTLVDQEIFSLEFGARLTAQLIQAVESPVVKLEFLQHMISTAHEWPDAHGDSFHVEFLELMYRSIKIAQSMELSAAELTKVLKGWLNDSTFLDMPVVMTSVLALKAFEKAHSEAIISSFLECWDIGATTAPKSHLTVLKEENDWDLFEETLPDVAPLLAVLSLSPATTASGREKLLRLTTTSEYNDFSVSFWGYICAILTTDRETGYWDPSVIWRLGFFTNGLPKNAPEFDLAGSYECLKFFWENRHTLDLENSHGESLTAPGVINMLAHHPLVTPELETEALQYLELLDWDPIDNFRVK